MAHVTTPLEDPKLSESGKALSAVLLSQRVLMETVDRRLRAELGVSFPLFEVLFVLSVAPEGRLRMIDIQRRMLVPRATSPS